MTTSPKKIFFIACESSGDQHTAELILELKKMIPNVEMRGLGGPKMVEVGVSIDQDMTQMSALGFGDVIRKYFDFRKVFYAALNHVKEWKPDLILVVDSPAFNIRFAKKVKSWGLNIPVVYYISPQLWAWGGRRIHVIKKTITKMLAILPFEKELYDKAGIDCEFVGHPLLDHITEDQTRPNEELRASVKSSGTDKIIGLLPGSREKEVSRIFPIMVQSAVKIQEKFPNAVFLIGKSPGISRGLYEEILKDVKLNIQFFEDRFYDHVSIMNFALVTSGTATLETALIGTPLFLLYKASLSTYILGKHLIQVSHLGLANLLAGKTIIPEFIQNDAKPEVIAAQAIDLLESPDRQAAMKNEFKKVRSILGDGGASRKAAESVKNFLLNDPKQVPGKQAVHS